MSDPDGSLPPTAGFDDARRIDAICDAFELAWKQNGGSRPSLDSFLERVPRELREAAAQELLPIEIAYLQRSGDTIPVDDYRQRYPFTRKQLEEWMSNRFLTQVHSRLAAGDRLGKYTILGWLAAGGMGEVYRAVDSTLDREVAIKVLHSRFALNAEALARIQIEAHALAALKHPNIVTVHEFAEQDGLAYMVLEFLEGETLAQRLKRAPLTPGEVLELASQLAVALAVAHEKKIIHRDLKPQNIFLTKDGQTKILDFGLARLLEQPATDAQPTPAPAHNGQTTAGARVGTAGYMSPEQVRGQAVDARSDVFSFGCVLYEMVSGRSAFVRSTMEESDRAVKEEPAPLLPKGPLSDLGPIVSRCLQKLPKRRYAAATELSRDLAALYANRQQRQGRFLRRIERSGIVALCLFVLVIGGWFARRAVLLSQQSYEVGEIAAAVQEDPPDIDRAKIAARRVHELARYLGYPAKYVDSANSRNGAIIEGLLKLEEGTHAAIVTALDRFNAAQGMDRDSAVARVGLGECYYRLASVYESAAVPMADMKKEAEAALLLDRNESMPSSAIAHALLGLYYHRFGRDWDQAKFHFERAIQINPESAFVRRSYGNSLVLQEDANGGIDQLLVALKTDPTSPELKVDLGLACLYSDLEDRFALAESCFREVLSAHPEHFPAQWAIGELRMHQRRYSDAIGELRKACKLDPDSPEAKAELAFSLGKDSDPKRRLERRSKARRIIAQLRGRAGTTTGQPGGRYYSFAALAVAQLGVGARGSAMKNLEQGEAEQEEWLIWLEIDPVFDDLRKDNRFLALQNRIGLWSKQNRSPQ